MRLISLAASSPFITGICQSSVTTSGRKCSDLLDRNLAILGFAAHFPVRVALNTRTDRVPNDGAVIDNQDPVRHATSSMPWQVACRADSNETTDGDKERQLPSPYVFPPIPTNTGNNVR